LRREGERGLVAVRGGAGSGERAWGRAGARDMRMGLLIGAAALLCWSAAWRPLCAGGAQHCGVHTCKGLKRKGAV
jgi:hypothetical protein